MFANVMNEEKVENSISSKTDNHSKRNNILIISLSFLVPALIFAAAYAYNGIYPGSEKTVFTYDLTHMNLPFYASLRYVLKGESSLFYETFSALGGGELPTFVSSYSGILPWLTVLFPLKNLPDAFYFMEVLQIGLCGLTFSLYLIFASEVKRPEKIMGVIIPIVFSTCYALSSYNVAYCFNSSRLDIIICLPLVLWSIERIINAKSGIFLSIVVAFCIATNYYLSFMAAIFVIFYLLIRFVELKRTFKEYLIIIVKCFFSSILGLGLTLPLIIPTVIGLLNSRIYLSNGEAEQSFWLHNPLEVLRCFLPMQDINYLNGVSTPFLFCGSISLVFFLLFFFNKNIKRSVRICVLGVFSFFVLSCCSYKLYVLWHGNKVPNGHPGRFTFIIIWFVVYIGYYACCEVLNSAAVYLQTGHLKRVRYILLFILVIFVGSELYLNTSNIFLKVNVLSIFERRKSFEYFINNTSKCLDIIRKDKDNYRVLNELCFSRNDSMMLGYNGFNMLHSNINQDEIMFFDCMAIDSGLNSMMDGGFTPVLKSLFGFKYGIYYGDIPFCFDNYFCDDTPIGVGINSNNLPLAYCVSSSVMDSLQFFSEDELNNQNIVLSDFLNKDVEVFKDVQCSIERTEVTDTCYEADFLVYPTKDNNIFCFFETVPSVDEIVFSGDPYDNYLICEGKKYNFMLYGNTFAVDLGKADKEVLEISTHSLCPFGIPHFKYFDEIEYKNAIQQLGKNGLNVSYYKKGKLIGDITTDEDGYLFFSIPYEKGYSAKIDGINTDLCMYRNTFIMIPIKRGTHSVELTYHTPGFYTGLLFSALSIMCLITELVLTKTHLNKKMG